MTYLTPHVGPARYAAVDLETTGLDTDDHLLEISVVILDAQLRERASYTTLVWQPDAVLADLDPTVREMHTTSGLLEAIATATSLPSLHKVEEQLLELLDEHQDADVPLHIAGGGIANFDVPFLRRNLPAFAARFHYRPIDFSIIRQAYKDANGHELRVPGYEHPHRAETDLRADVQVGRILYNALRDAHRAAETTAPIIDPHARETAVALVEQALTTGVTPSVPEATPDLAEALIDIIRQRA